MRVQKLNFQPLEEPLELEGILRERLPLSTNVYNMMRLNKDWRKEQRWFTLGDRTLESQVWLVAIYYREDFGQSITVSRPKEIIITPEIREAFASCDFIDWTESYFFLVDPQVSPMITDISIRGKGNITEVHPCNLYTIDQGEARQLQLIYQDVEIKPLDLEKGMDFLMKTWKYASPEAVTYIQKCLTSHPSAGVYLNGEVVASAIFDGHGLIGMLYALNEYRGKGYGKLAMHFMMKKTAEDGFMPGCTVELRNDVSKRFQEKIGLSAAAVLDYVVVRKPEF